MYPFVVKPLMNTLLLSCFVVVVVVFNFPHFEKFGTQRIERVEIIFILTKCYICGKYPFAVNNHGYLNTQHFQSAHGGCNRYPVCLTLVSLTLVLKIHESEM